VAAAALRHVARERHCHFPHLERHISKLAPRPLLMIHGGADTYIKPEMAQALFDRARHPKALWLVEGAKHNQAFHVANGHYQERVRAFFDNHLAPEDKGAKPAHDELTSVRPAPTAAVRQ
jgi:alpha-beta hydrolase superfamily lysophospholipase